MKILKSTVIVVLALTILITTAGCGTIFWGAESDSTKRGKINGWALLLDIIPGFLLGAIPILVDAITGGLWYQIKTDAPPPRHR